LICIVFVIVAYIVVE